MISIAPSLRRRPLLIGVVWAMVLSGCSGSEARPAGSDGPPRATGPSLGAPDASYPRGGYDRNGVPVASAPGGPLGTAQGARFACVVTIEDVGSADDPRRVVTVRSGTRGLAWLEVIGPAGRGVFPVDLSSGQASVEVPPQVSVSVASVYAAASLDPATLSCRSA